MDPSRSAEEYPEVYPEQRSPQPLNDPPPPHSSLYETMQPTSPTEAPVLDENDDKAIQARYELLYQSWPHNQFQSQVNREHERIIYQVEHGRKGRRQTLPFDEKSDLIANAKNNVRAYWVEQGIWMDKWGPAYPKAARIMNHRGVWSLKVIGKGPRVSGRWGHETRPEPGEYKSEPEPAPGPAINPNGSIFGIPHPRVDLAALLRPHPAPKAPEKPLPPRDFEASRPYHQFSYQVSKEREWVKDELLMTGSIDNADIDAIAYENTKRHWMEDGVWNANWGEMPGMTWLHEDMEDEDERAGRLEVQRKGPNYWSEQQVEE
ncbi:hypothetical protein N0V90_012853 [Kalmusia sp. IMI 367209]|nr:hypothetical protein N0V90_012853 [Kalmusia sp. IMI 367209]